LSCKPTGQISQCKKYTIDHYENTDIIGGEFSPDEKNILFTSNKSGVYNAYSINIETKKLNNYLIQANLQCMQFHIFRMICVFC